MERIILEQLKNELFSGVKKRGHPFRYFTLGTVDDKYCPHLRTVVLRDVTDAMELVFFTDYRSQKIGQIRKNPLVSGLFYHPDKLMQVQIHGKAELTEDDRTIAHYWGQVPPSSAKEYTTSKAPSSALEKPEDVDYLKDSPHFCVVKIVLRSITYLKLNDPNHIKVHYTKVGDTWQHQFLVP